MNGKKTQALTDQMESEIKAREVRAADVCRGQCQAGGACTRKMCTGAAALARSVQGVLDGAYDRPVAETFQLVQGLCSLEIEAGTEAGGPRPEVGTERPNDGLSFVRHILTLAEEIDGSNWGMGVTGIIETCRREIAEEVTHG